VRADSGKFEGTVILQEEQEAGVEFARFLSAEELAEATLAAQNPSPTRLPKPSKTTSFSTMLDFRHSKLKPAKRKRWSS